MSIATDQTLERRIDELLALRSDANRRYFEDAAPRVGPLCHAMAERFAQGGRLIAIGRSATARSDVRHVAVEFVHPVIVGKRALPAIGLASEGGSLRRQLDGVAESRDIVIAFGIDQDRSGESTDALALARSRGCLTIAFAAADADCELEPPAGDPFVAQELIETLYHVLWELVHVFFEHRGLLSGREEGAVHDPGASSFLYPFLNEGERNLRAVLEDVSHSAAMKSAEVGALRERTLRENSATLARAAAVTRRSLDAGAKLLAFGNGGSATDAMDLVADMRAAPQGWRSRRAIDLTEDAAILTAIANDIGIEEVFQRQLIAYGRAGDVAVAFSTSGSSLNLIEALTEARRRQLTTIAFLGYDGGRIAAEGLADHVVVVHSQHIPRIQEAQASAYHVLRELIELVDAE